MKKNKNVLLILAAGFLMLGCDHETRNGSLSLSGSSPVRIVDEGGKTVEFLSGPVKVDFSAGSSRKFTVEMEQGGRKAKFSGKVPESNDWNFTLRGRDIGQWVDFASSRSVSLYGPISTSIGRGGSCGFDGNYVTEESWQKGNEDWTVAFNDANTGAGVGSFKSRREGDSYLVGSRDLWCRENHRHEPGGRHGLSTAVSSVNKLTEQLGSGVKFD